MNFRTTTVLVALLVAALVFVFVANRNGEPQASGPTATHTNPLQGQALFDVSSDQLDHLVIRPASGKSIELTKTGDQWQIVQPIHWPADSSEITGLLDSIVGLHSRGSVDLTAANAASTGLDKPRYQIQATGDGKTIQLAIGGASAIGSDLYVKVSDAKEAQVVPAGTLAAKAKQSPEKLLGALRDKQLVSLSLAQIQQAQIDRRTGKLVLEKTGPDWKLTQPAVEKAEDTSVTDLLSTITGLRATEFTDEATAAAAGARLDQPRLTVWLSSAAPTTQPTTQPTTRPAGVSVAIGEPVDIDAAKVWVKVNDPGRPTVVAQASLSQTAFTQLVDASPLSLRDRKVLDIDPDKVNQIAISIDRPSTTQPTTHPAEQKTIRIARRKAELSLGPALSAPIASSLASPSTQPATAPATGSTTEPATALSIAIVPTTRPTTAPAEAGGPATRSVLAATSGPSTAPASSQPIAEKKSNWVIESEGGIAADDEQVTQLLTDLHPLRAEKYLEKSPSTQPSATCLLEIKTVGAGGADTATYELRITDPGGEGKPVASYHDLTFETDRELLNKLEGDFKTPKPPVVPPTFRGEPPHGLPPGFPGGE